MRGLLVRQKSREPRAGAPVHRCTPQSADLSGEMFTSRNSCYTLAVGAGYTGSFLGPVLLNLFPEPSQTRPGLDAKPRPSARHCNPGLLCEALCQRAGSFTSSGPKVQRIFCPVGFSLSVIFCGGRFITRGRRPQFDEECSVALSRLVM